MRHSGSKSGRGFAAGGKQPLIGVLDSDGMVRYFTDEVDSDAATSAASIQRALSALGAWDDLDWAAAKAELDRIRHASPPSPPLDL